MRIELYGAGSKVSRRDECHGADVTLPAPLDGRSLDRVRCSLLSHDPGPLDSGRLARDLKPIAQCYPEVAALWIFGSAARNELRSDSDVDVGVLFNRSANGKGRILAELGARLESLTAPYPVDAVDLEAQGVIFAHRALCDGRLIYEADTDRRVDFESTTCVRAFDFLPTHELSVRGQREGLLRRMDRERDRRRSKSSSRGPNRFGPT